MKRIIPEALGFAALAYGAFWVATLVAVAQGVYVPYGPPAWLARLLAGLAT